MVDLDSPLLFHVKGPKAKIGCRCLPAPKRAEAPRARSCFTSAISTLTTCRYYWSSRLPSSLSTASLMKLRLCTTPSGLLSKGWSASDARADDSDEDDDDDGDRHDDALPMCHRITKSPLSDTDTEDGMPLCRMQKVQPPKKKRKLVLHKKNSRR